MYIALVVQRRRPWILWRIVIPGGILWWRIVIFSSRHYLARRCGR
jgi:hypothetical protein